MLVEERRQRVLELASKRGFIALEELTKAIPGASESTLRRDIKSLQKAGVLRKTRGGAFYIGNGGTLPALEDRAAAQLEEKQRIAATAAARIRNGDSVLLDGGTTTLEVAKKLVGRQVQIVT